MSEQTDTNQAILDLLPFEPTVLNMIRAERSGEPVILKNGAKVRIYGWCKFFKVDDQLH